MIFKKKQNISIVFLSLGSNIGNRKIYIEASVKLINKFIGIVLKESSFYKSQPWGMNNNTPFFINKVIMLKSEHSPNKILKKILFIESFLGRNKSNHDYYDNRKIDIDILFYNEDIIIKKNLYIPHLLLHMRKFILLPLNEISPYKIHPLLKLNIKILLKICKDRLYVHKV